MLDIKISKSVYLFLIVGLLILFSCGEKNNPVQPTDSEVIINPETKVLKQGTMQYVKHIAENEIVFESQANGISDLKTGNIIVSGEGRGLLRKVTSTEITQTEIKVQTEPAKLTDVFEQASININQQLKTDDFNNVTPLKKGVSFIEAKDDLFEFEIENLVLYDVDGNYETVSDQVTANGSLSVSNPKLQIEIDISSFSIKYLLFTGTMDQTSDLEINSEIKLIDINKEFEIVRLEGTPIVIFVGGIPIVLTPVFSVSVGFDVEAGTSVSTSVASVKQTAEYTAGIVYKKGNVVRVSDFSNQFDYNLPTVSVNCKLKGYAYPKFEILLYNFVSLYLKPVEYLEIDAEIYNNPWWELYAGFEVFIGIAVDVFNLFDIKYEYQVIEHKYVLADAGGPFYSPSYGLIAYYPFNGNVNDESEHQNHGIIHGASLTRDRFENPNKAFRFDGTDDYIEIPYTATNHPVNGITVVCWFKIDSLKGHQDIISTNQFGGYAIEFHDDNNLYWEIRIGSKYINLPISSSEVTLHTWHCVAGSYDGKIIKIYFDGILKNERIRQGSIHYAHKNTVLIGADAYEDKGPDPGFGYFKGIVDDIHIYNRVLTEGEIQALYHNN